MRENFVRSIIIFIALLVIIGGGIYQLKQTKTSFPVIEAKEEYSQPELPISNGETWRIRSIDTQVISKHWEDVSPESINQQVLMLKALGVNYIAIGTPYDRPEEMRMWVEAIHREGIHVWFRSHWLEWEGDDGKPATMTSEEYLRRTSAFIRANPDLFKEGDSFTVAVEPEQVGVGLGKRFLDWNEYRNFLLLQISTANAAFEQIGLERKIYTNWISVNGWVVENEFNQELVNKMGLITVDHFVHQSQTLGKINDGEAVVENTEKDLDRFHEKWGVPIMLGEWGYQIFQEVPEDVQAEVVSKMFARLKDKDYLIGINYWVHMGHNSKIINDTYGDELTYRKAAGVIKTYFDPENKVNESVSITPTPTNKN